MAVYVDALMHYGAQSGFFKGKASCHMFADTLDELHEMAAKIGMKRSWFQDEGSLQHYDLVQSRRNLAIVYGAIEITDRKQLVTKWNELRVKRGLKPIGGTK